jgi:hypothetical protein
LRDASVRHRIFTRNKTCLQWSGYKLGSGVVLELAGLAKDTLDGYDGSERK